MKFSLLASQTIIRHEPLLIWHYVIVNHITLRLETSEKIAIRLINCSGTIKSFHQAKILILCCWSRRRCRPGSRLNSKTIQSSCPHWNREQWECIRKRDACSYIKNTKKVLRLLRGRPSRRWITQFIGRSSTRRGIGCRKSQESRKRRTEFDFIIAFESFYNPSMKMLGTAASTSRKLQARFI